jgi:hypothetical protein
MSSVARCRALALADRTPKNATPMEIKTMSGVRSETQLKEEATQTITACAASKAGVSEHCTDLIPGAFSKHRNLQLLCLNLGKLLRRKGSPVKNAKKTFLRCLTISEES